MSVLWHLKYIVNELSAAQTTNNQHNLITDVNELLLNYWRHVNFGYDLNRFKVPYLQ